MWKLIVIALCIAALFVFGYVRLQNTQGNMSIELNKEKIRQTTEQAVEKTEELVGDVEKQVQEEAQKESPKKGIFHGR